MLFFSFSFQMKLLQHPSSTFYPHLQFHILLASIAGSYAVSCTRSFSLFFVVLSTPLLAGVSTEIPATSDTCTFCSAHAVAMIPVAAQGSISSFFLWVRLLILYSSPRHKVHSHAVKAIPFCGATLLMLASDPLITTFAGQYGMPRGIPVNAAVPSSPRHRHTAARSLGASG